MRQNQSSFNRKHPKEPSSYSNHRTSKTQLDYYENYPYLIPPYALNNYQAYLQLMYPGSLGYTNAKQQGMLAPPILPQGLLAPGMFHPGLVYPANYGQIPPSYVKKFEKIFLTPFENELFVAEIRILSWRNQLFPLKGYDLPVPVPIMGYAATAEGSIVNIEFSGCLSL